MTPTKGLKIRLKRKGDALDVPKLGKASVEGDGAVEFQSSNSEDMKAGTENSRPSLTVSPVSSGHDVKEEQLSREEPLTDIASVPMDTTHIAARISVSGEEDQKPSADKSEAMPVGKDAVPSSELPKGQETVPHDTSSAVDNGVVADDATKKHPDLEQVRIVVEESPACSSGQIPEALSPKAPVPSVEQEPLTRELYQIPSYAGWFSWNRIHTIERRALSEFFEGKSPSKTPKIYKDYRDFIINRYRENPQKRLTFTEVRKMLIGDVNCLRKVFEFLDRWGLINYHVAAGEKIFVSSISSLPLPEPSLSGLEIVFPVVTSDVSVPTTQRIGASMESKGPPKATLASHEDVFNISTKEEFSQARMGPKSSLCEDLNADSKAEDVGESERTQKGKESQFPNTSAGTEVRRECTEPSQVEPEANKHLWTQEETIHLLEGITKYGENWNRVADYVGTKSKDQCIMQFIQLPYADPFMDALDSGMSETMSTLTEGNKVDTVKEAMVVANSVGSSEIPPFKKQKIELIPETGSPNEEDIKQSIAAPPSCTTAETILPEQGYVSPYCDSSNPLFAQVAFMSALVGPRVAAAAAQAALTVLSEEDPALSLLSVPATGLQTGSKKDGTPVSSNHMEKSLPFEQILRDVPNSHASDEEGDKEMKQDGEPEGKFSKESLPLAVQVRASYATALAAATTNAKLLADQEEREIEHLMASIIENQVKKLHSKLEHFEELEFLLEKERMQLEQARAQVFADRLKLAQQQFSVGTSGHKLNDFPRHI